MDLDIQWAITFGLFSVPVALAYNDWVPKGIIYVYFCILILIAFIIPITFYSSLFLQRWVLYFYFLGRTDVEDLKQPEKYGFSKSTNFYVKNEEISMGVWHLLPTLQELNASDYENSLGDESPIVLYIHGNLGTRASEHRVQLYHILLKLNYHVITFDFRCFGESTYKTPHEQAVASDCFAVAKWVIKRSGSSPLFLYGHSLGSGFTTNVAAQLANEGYNVKGVILESAFNDMPSEIKLHPLGKIFRLFPWYNFLMSSPYETNGEDFRSSTYIQKFTAPILLLHAEDDEIVPSCLGKKLYLIGQKSRGREFGPMTLHLFPAHRKLSHTNICSAPEIPSILRNFIEAHKNKKYKTSPSGARDN